MADDCHIDKWQAPCRRPVNVPVHVIPRSVPVEGQILKPAILFADGRQMPAMVILPSNATIFADGTPKPVTMFFPSENVNRFVTNIQMVEEHFYEGALENQPIIHGTVHQENALKGHVGLRRPQQPLTREVPMENKKPALKWKHKGFD